MYATTDPTKKRERKRERGGGERERQLGPVIAWIKMSFSNEGHDPVRFAEPCESNNFVVTNPSLFTEPLHNPYGHNSC